MATAPMCKICGSRHWASDPHQFNPPASRAGEEGRPTVKDVKRFPPAEAAPAGIVSVKKRAPRGTFDRTAYQREYMRLRRRQKKAKSP